METTTLQEPLWRIWVDARQRIVSFHPEENSQLLEFRSRELYMKCVEEYSARQYRYQ